ncbi:MAG: hypothetical protein ACRENG_35085, partial [bacterium]
MADAEIFPSRGNFASTAAGGVTMLCNCIYKYQRFFPKMQALKFGERKYFAVSILFLCCLYSFCVSKFKFVSVPVCFLNSPELENPFGISDGAQFIGKTPKLRDLLKIRFIRIKIPQGSISPFKGFVLVNRHNLSFFPLTCL